MKFPVRLDRRHDLLLGRYGVDDGNLPQKLLQDLHFPRYVAGTSRSDR